MTDQARSAKRWGWTILLSTGGISLTYNIAHALGDVGADTLDRVLGVLYGVAPVLVALMLSHLIGIQRGGRWKKVITFAVFIAALSLSVSAIAAVLEPTAGPLGYVFAIMLDVASLMGLNEILTVDGPTDSARTAERRTAADKHGQDRTVPDATGQDRTDTDGAERSRTAEPPTAPQPAPVPYAQPPHTEPLRTAEPRTAGPYGAVDQPLTDEVRAAPDGLGADRTDGEDLGKARTAGSSTPPVRAAEPVKAARMAEPYGPGTQRRTDPGMKPEPARTAQVTRLIDRTEFVGHMADNIRTVEEIGGTWRPNYRALMRTTGRGRSWCEKAVRAAREAAAEEQELVMEGAHG